LNEKSLITQLDHFAKEAVYKSLDEHGYILYSGGVDSSVLASLVSRKVNQDQWNLFTVGVFGSQDIRNSITEAGIGPIFSPLPLLVREVDQQRIIHALKEIKSIVSVHSVSHLEDCTAFYVICEEINKQTRGEKNLLLSANGPDELFCGYDRFRRIVDVFGYDEAEREINRALEIADILRENVNLIAKCFDVKIVEPFFDSDFVSFCVQKIPIQLKIQRGNDTLRKRIWRHYAQYLGIPKEIAERPKKAMQYSMGIHKIVLPLIKRQQLFS
jgi:asparagine synthase (glutamine-hydrolysing)